MSHLIISCPHCLQKNRFPHQRLAENPKCGNCKTSIFPKAPINVTDASFNTLVIDSPLAVVVDFWAPWCGPCRMMEEPLNQIASEMTTKLIIAKLNVDDNPRIAQHYQIQSIPQLSIFKKGQIVNQQLGAQSLPTLKRWIGEWI